MFLSKFFLSILLSLFVLSKTEEINLTCNFSVYRSIYKCTIQPFSIPDDESLKISISGEHLPEYTDLNVTVVDFESGFHGLFVINQIFQTFENLIDIQIEHAGLHRIQEDALVGAENLFNFNAFDNPLRFIGPRAFSGAPNLTYIELSRGLVEYIDETAFDGLENLVLVELSNLQLKTLPPKIFSQNFRLRTLWLNSNFLTSIDGDIFAKKPYLNLVSLSENRINAIGENIFDDLEVQVFFRLSLDVNRCADTSIVIFRETDMEPIREKLAKCFENFRESEIETTTEEEIEV